MAQPSLDELVNSLSREDVEISIYRVMAKVGLRTSTWKPGAVVRAIVTGVAAVIAALSFVIAAVTKLGFLELSRGPWLTLVAKYCYGVDRIPASFAGGYVTINNAGGGVYSFDPGDLVVINPTTGKSYRNVLAVSVAALATGISVQIEAVEAGSPSTSFAGTITGFATVYPGLSVTNAKTIVGTDDEPDKALISRCKNKLATLSSNGPAGAYEYWAKTATRADGNNVGINRVKVVTGPGDGSAYIYVSSVAGEVPGTTTDPTSDLGIVYQTLLLNVTPPGGTIHLISTAFLPITINYDLYIYTTVGKTQTEITTAISSELSSVFLPSVPIGGDRPNDTDTNGWLYRDGIISAIKSVFPDDIFHVVLNSPASDVSIDPTQAPSINTITANTVVLAIRP